MLKRLLLKIAIIGIIIVSFTACSAQQPSDDTQFSQKDYRLDTLKLAGGTDWGMPNPYLQDPRGPGTAKMKLVFDSLLEADERGDIPWLAKEWRIDGNTYTFTINENARFHDGERVTTEDIAFSIDYYKKYPPVNNYLASAKGNIISGYEIVDDTTIKIAVFEPLATTLSQLGVL